MRIRVDRRGRSPGSDLGVGSERPTTLFAARTGHAVARLYAARRRRRPPRGCSGMRSRLGSTTARRRAPPRRVLAAAPRSEASREEMTDRARTAGAHPVASVRATARQGPCSWRLVTQSVCRSSPRAPARAAAAIDAVDRPPRGRRAGSARQRDQREAERRSGGRGAEDEHAARDRARLRRGHASRRSCRAPRRAGPPRHRPEDVDGARQVEVAIAEPRAR